jgi:hypothetical protein
MEEHRLVSVSPKHRVRLAGEYAVLLDKPQKRDFVVRTIEKRQANGLPLMTAEIVIAGVETRSLHPLSEKYPLHFRKTYFAARLRGDPAHEFESAAQASGLLGLPPPIGYTHESFRSCLVPGVPYARLSPFGADPESRNLHVAHELPLGTAAGLWRFLEQGFSALETLHEAGLAHGDAELSNFLACPTPLGLVLVDFESAVKREALDAAAWTERRADDLAPLLREALFLQCSIGLQEGALAQRAWDEAPRVLKEPERFRRAIEEHPDLGVSGSTSP